ncbi:MAG: hypothetical protein HYU86_04100 [Chloroflexi bacterium]|nr:hypothetical protein [Chloroflexota bacterium]
MNSISFRLVHLSVSYNTALFPFDILELSRMLPSVGYVILQELPVQFGARLGMSGVLAKKGDTALSLNSERYTVTTQTQEPNAALEEFEFIERLIEEEFGFRGEEHASFYEVISEATVRTKKNPLLMVEEHSRSISLLGRLSKALGHPVGVFGFRLVPPGADPNRPDWFDIRIEPEVLNCTRRLSISIIFRNHERPKVLQFVRTLPQVLTNLVAELEE